MSSSGLYFLAALLFVLGAIAMAVSGHAAGVAIIAPAAVMVVAGVRERRATR